MLKEEYREANERDMELYDKSILSHDDDKTDSIKDYESSILHHRDYDDEDNNHSQSMDDYEWHIGHFKD